MRHELKVYPKYFKALWCGDKTFEIRYNDRNFEERDEILLEEYEPHVEDGIEIRDAGEYSGRAIEGIITYLTNFEQKADYVVFSFREIGRTE